MILVELRHSRWNSCLFHITFPPASSSPTSSNSISSPLLPHSWQIPLQQMAKTELDFFGLEKENSSSKSQFQKLLERRPSFTDIQSAISKINPELIKSAFASGSVNQNVDAKKSISSRCTPTDLMPTFFPVLPVLSPVSRISSSENLPATAPPLTIFYNGMVSVFNVPQDKAESILKIAVEGCFKKVESADFEVAVPSSDQQQLLESLNDGDLPLARRKSLQRFIEKRKERLTSVMPYACST